MQADVFARKVCLFEGNLVHFQSGEVSNLLLNEPRLATKKILVLCEVNFHHVPFCALPLWNSSYRARQKAVWWHGLSPDETFLCIHRPLSALTGPTASKCSFFLSSIDVYFLAGYQFFGFVNTMFFPFVLTPCIYSIINCIAYWFCSISCTA